MASAANGATSTQLPSSSAASVIAVPDALSAPNYTADYLHNPTPDYPSQAVRLRLEGTTLLRVLVSREGQPLRVELLSSSGARLLDVAAEKAVARYRFLPARQGQQAVEASVQVPIVWKLQDGD